MLSITAGRFAFRAVDAMGELFPLAELLDVAAR